MGSLVSLKPAQIKKMTIAELQNVCRTNNLSGYSKLNSPDLIALVLKERTALKRTVRAGQESSLTSIKETKESKGATIATTASQTGKRARDPSPEPKKPTKKLKPNPQGQEPGTLVTAEGHVYQLAGKMEKKEVSKQRNGIHNTIYLTDLADIAAIGAGRKQPKSSWN